MKIAIASGKGGTGKTLVATCLFASFLKHGYQAAFCDCDVETPNAALFLHPNIHSTELQTLLRPVIDEEKCIGCEKCAEVCLYKAISLVKKRPILFAEMCHGCGGCARICPVEAIVEKEWEIGQIEQGNMFLQGKLRVGEALSPVLIRKIKKKIPETDFCCLDCAPGTACSLVASLLDVDFALLVAESTPFGLHDLQLAVAVAQDLNIPIGVFINRSEKECAVRNYCKDQKLPVIGELPERREIAQKYAKGELAIFGDDEVQDVFDQIVEYYVRRK